MRHHIKGRKLNRTSSHRKALFANLATALVTCGQIRTTLPKAKDLRPYVEKLVTKARAGGLHNRRQLASALRSEEAAKRLCEEIAPQYKDRPGGYTRVLKAGFRNGDNAPMAVISFVGTDAGEPVEVAS